MGTTMVEEERFHQVADEFDGPTRRRVKRLVLRGTPPIDDDLGPLARAYSVNLAGSVATRPNLLFWTQIPLGVWWTVMGVYKVFWTADAWGAVFFLVMGIGYGSVIAPLSRLMAKRARDGLARSRSLLGLEPLSAIRPERGWRLIGRHSVRHALRRIW